MGRKRFPEKGIPSMIPDLPSDPSYLLSLQRYSMNLFLSATLHSPLKWCCSPTKDQEVDEAALPEDGCPPGDGGGLPGGRGLAGQEAGGQGNYIWQQNLSINSRSEKRKKKRKMWWSWPTNMDKLMLNQLKVWFQIKMRCWCNLVFEIQTFRISMKQLCEAISTVC